MLKKDRLQSLNIIPGSFLKYTRYKGVESELIRFTVFISWLNLSRKVREKRRIYIT